jgi:broad specificity phosphatase PhoE
VTRCTRASPTPIARGARPRRRPRGRARRRSPRCARALQGLQALRAVHTGQTICLVSHGITARLLILEALGLGPERLWTFHLSSTGISELEFREDWTTLHRMNSLIHLADHAIA